MARIKIQLPDSFEFSTEIAVRINDINYGGHLGHDSILTLTHEARVRFLKKLGYTELDIEGLGIMATDVVIEYKSESFYGENLIIDIASADFLNYGFDMIYRITEKESSREIARVKTGLVFYNYHKKELSIVPKEFLSVTKPKSYEIDIIRPNK